MQQLKPIITGASLSLQQARPLYRKLPKLFLHHTKDTITTCTVCRGEGVIVIRSPNAKTMSYTRCIHCRGNKKLSNNPDKYTGDRLPL